MSQGIGKTGLAFARVWHEIDVQDLILGKVASHIAKLLTGKHKPIFHPSVDCGDYVVVKNATKVRVTGNKSKEKMYHFDSGYPGGRKQLSFQQLMAKNPDLIIRRAVQGMLPKNKLRIHRLERLLVFPNDNHPYQHNIHKDYIDPSLKSLPEVTHLLAKLTSKDFDASLRVGNMNNQ